MSTKMENRWLAIRGQLESVADLLSKQGAITSKRASGRRVWRVAPLWPRMIEAGDEFTNRCTSAAMPS